MSTAELLVENSKLSHDPGEYDFLSPERQQKYDLLLHLLANLGQPVFLSGPEGIGKSTFLAQLRDHPPPGWQVLLLQATPATDLEQVRKSLAGGKLQGAVTVLALDDAGCLLPGVLDEACRFVAQAVNLRLIAAIRPDELHLKAVSDPWAVGEAQVVELPPLTEQQCAAYFERLWLQRGRSGEPDPELVQEIYRRTHGIPARIQQEVLELFGRPPLRWHLTLARPMYLALAVVVAAVVAVTHWQATKQKEQTESLSRPTASTQSAPAVQSLPPTPIVKQSVEVTAPKPEVAEVTPSVSPVLDPAPQMTQTSTASIQSAEENQGAEIGRLPDQVSRSIPSQVVAVEEPPKFELPAQEKPKTAHPEATKGTLKPPAEPPVPKKAPPKPEAVTPVAETQQPPPAPESPKLQDAASEVAKAAGIQPREWVLKRSPDHFALQIGFFQDPKALAAFARRHPGLRPLAYYPKGKGYVLLYGAFRSISEVQQATRRLPPDVGQASIWRFKSVQDAVRSLPSPSVKEP